MAEEDDEIAAADAPESAGEGSGSPSASLRRLTEAEYAQIRDLYELGVKGIKELAEQFDVSRQTISKRFKDDGVTRGSRAHEVAAATRKAAIEAVTPPPVVARYHEKREDWIEETRVKGYEALKQAEMLARKTMAEAIRGGKSPSSTEDDMKALQRYQNILSQNIESRLNLLNADEFQSEEDLPNLVVEDLTEDDILEHHKRISDDLSDDATLADIAEEIGGLDVEVTED